MHNARYGLTLLLTLVSLFLISCITTVQEPTATPMQAVTVEVPFPVTVEVTRIVAKEVIVEATPSPPLSCAPTSFEDANELVIGALLPLSTSGDILSGFAMQTALSIAVAEINEAGGVRGLPLRLLTFDSGGNADQAASLVQRLAREYCAVAITGLYHDETALAAAARAESLGVPVIVAGATTDRLPSAKHRFTFRIAPSDTMLAEMPAKWMAEVGDFKQDGELFVVLVVDSRQTSAPDIARLKTKLTETGIRSEFLPVDLPASDFSSVIARMVTMDQVPDAVFILVDGEAALELEQQIRTAGFGPQKNTLIVNSEAALDSVQFWQLVPGGIGTVVSRIGPWYKTATPAGQNFALKYAKYFGHWPEYYAFAAYDAVYLLANALERSATPSGEDLRESIAATDAMLSSGHYSFPYTSPHREGESQQPDHYWNQWPEVHTLFLQYDETGQSSSDMPVVWPPNYRSSDGPLSWRPADSE